MTAVNVLSAELEVTHLVIEARSQFQIHQRPQDV